MATRTDQRSVLLRWMIVASAIIFVLASRHEPASSASAIQSDMPGPDSRELWRYITKDNPYKSWRSFPNFPGRFAQVKENPHGDWIAVYVNDPAYESMEHQGDSLLMKYASIIVKENYSPSRGDPVTTTLTSVPVTLTSLTVMYKIKGYQRALGENEWFWVMYACPKGQCDGGVATISDQPFVNEQIPKSRDTFAFYKGEVVAGKPWICVECHQRAVRRTDFAAGDYVWKLKPFSPK